MVKKNYSKEILIAIFLLVLLAIIGVAMKFSGGTALAQQSGLGLIQSFINPF